MKSLLQEQADAATKQRRQVRAKDFAPMSPTGTHCCPACRYVSTPLEGSLMGEDCPSCYLGGEGRVRMVRR
jgi:hypothetical protein